MRTRVGSEATDRQTLPGRYPPGAAPRLARSTSRAFPVLKRATSTSPRRRTPRVAFCTAAQTLRLFHETRAQRPPVRPHFSRYSRVNRTDAHSLRARRSSTDRGMQHEEYRRPSVLREGSPGSRLLAARPHKLHVATFVRKATVRAARDQVRLDGLRALVVPQLGFFSVH